MMILEFDVKTVGHRGRPKHVTETVPDRESALALVRGALKRTKRDREQKVVSNIVLRSQ